MPPTLAFPQNFISLDGVSSLSNILVSRILCSEMGGRYNGQHRTGKNVCSCQRGYNKAMDILYYK